MPSPDPKRQLRATASVESTAETYGRRHGIPEDVQAALQNVGWRSRQGELAWAEARSACAAPAVLPRPYPANIPAVAMGAPGAGGGRSLQPTQSLPALPGSFMTAHQTYAHAQAVIDKEASRRHELQPMAFGSPAQEAVNNLGLSPRRERDRSLSFTPEGDALVRGQKRREDDEEGSGTDVDDDVVLPAPSTPITAAAADDFPAVFTSPVISQPELFVRPAPGSMAPPPLPGRATRSLPRRGFSKTVSAPVGRLGTFSGMDVDMPFVVGAPAGFAAEGAEAPEEQEEDGFDVSEWASSENF